MATSVLLGLCKKCRLTGFFVCGRWWEQPLGWVGLLTDHSPPARCWGSQNPHPWESGVWLAFPLHGGSHRLAPVLEDRDRSPGAHARGQASPHFLEEKGKTGLKVEKGESRCPYQPGSWALCRGIRPVPGFILNEILISFHSCYPWDFTFI